MRRSAFTSSVVALFVVAGVLVGVSRLAVGQSSLEPPPVKPKAAEATLVGLSGAGPSSVLVTPTAVVVPKVVLPVAVVAVIVGHVAPTIVLTDALKQPLTSFATTA